MTRIIKAVAFDLDGTLLNTLTDIAVSMNYALKMNGISEQPLADYNLLVGGGIPKLIERVLLREKIIVTDRSGSDNKIELNEAQKELMASILEAFNEHYIVHLADHTLPYDGIEELLQDLAKTDLRLFVLTNKPQVFADELIEKFFPTGLFCRVFGQDGKFPPKPDLKFTEQLHFAGNLPLTNIAMIGDSNVDIWTANNADMLSIGVSWGFRTAEELNSAGADYVVNRPSEIKKILLTDER